MITNTRSKQILERDISIGTHQSGPNKYKIPRNGLICEWLLNGDATCGLGGYSGTANNISWVNSGVAYNNQIAEFNGANGHIVINDSAELRLTGNYCISFSIKRANNTNTQRVINKDNANDFSGGYSVYLATKTAGLFNLAWSHNNGTNKNWDTEYTPPVGERVQIICEFNGTTRFLYINGVFHSSLATSGNIIGESTNNLFFGTYGASTALGQYFQGEMGIFREYNRTLSMKEKQMIYKEHLKLLH